LIDPWLHSESGLDAIRIVSWTIPNLSNAPGNGTTSQKPTPTIPKRASRTSTEVAKRLNTTFFLDESVETGYPSRRKCPRSVTSPVIAGFARQKIPP